MMTACTFDTSSEYNDLIQDNNQTTQPEAEVNIPEQIEQPPDSTEQPIFEQPPDLTEQSIDPPPDVDTGFSYMEFFAPIINAYAKLEQSGFLIHDDDLITDSLLEVRSGWGRCIIESLSENRAWILHKYREHELPNLV